MNEQGCEYMFPMRDLYMSDLKMFFKAHENALNMKTIKKYSHALFLKYEEALRKTMLYYDDPSFYDVIIIEMLIISIFEPEVTDRWEMKEIGAISERLFIALDFLIIYTDYRDVTDSNLKEDFYITVYEDDYFHVHFIKELLRNLSLSLDLKQCAVYTFGLRDRIREFLQQFNEKHDISY